MRVNTEKTTRISDLEGNLKTDIFSQGVITLFQLKRDHCQRCRLFNMGFKDIFLGMKIYIVFLPHGSIKKIDFIF